MNAGARSGGWVLCGLLATAAHAGCSRAIETPLAPVGQSVRFDGAQPMGIYPTLLSELGASLGCEFHMSRVPRARLETMFDAGQADLLVPSSQSASRDARGEFLPLIQVRASLLTLRRSRAASPYSLAELVAQPSYKLAVVRGFTFSPAYDRAIATLRAQHRLVEESDPAGVARALRQGLAHGSIMTPHILAGTLAQEPDLAPLLQQMRSQPLAELGWADSGLYLSHQLGEADRQILRTALNQAARSGRLWQLFSDGYPPGSLRGSMRPLQR